MKSQCTGTVFIYDVMVFNLNKLPLLTFFLALKSFNRFHFACDPGKDDREQLHTKTKQKYSATCGHCEQINRMKILGRKVRISSTSSRITKGDSFKTGVLEIKLGDGTMTPNSNPRTSDTSSASGDSQASFRPYQLGEDWGMAPLDEEVIFNEDDGGQASESSIDDDQEEYQTTRELELRESNDDTKLGPVKENILQQQSTNDTRLQSCRPSPLSMLISEFISDNARKHHDSIKDETRRQYFMSDLFERFESIRKDSKRAPRKSLPTECSVINFFAEVAAKTLDSIDSEENRDEFEKNIRNGLRKTFSQEIELNSKRYSRLSFDRLFRRK